MYLVGIYWLSDDAGAQVAIIYSHLGPSGRLYACIYLWMLIKIGLYLGRAPGTKETLPDFREKYRVTRHSRVFSRVDG